MALEELCAVRVMVLCSHHGSLVLHTLRKQKYEFLSFLVNSQIFT